MLYETYDNPKLLPFKDDKEERQLESLVAESLSIVGKLAMGQRLDAAEDARYDSIHQAIAGLREKLLQRYVASFADPAEGIMQDMRSILGSYSAEDIRVLIADTIKEREGYDDGLRKLLVDVGYNYTTVHMYMTQAVKAQLLAVHLSKGDTDKAEALIAEAAALIYPPQEGEAEQIGKHRYPEWEEALPAAQAVIITEIGHATHYLNPTSKVARKMREVAKEPHGFGEITVGLTEGGDEVVVNETVQPPAGIELTAYDYRIQNAVADLVYRASNAQEEFPIRITPAQIGKTFAGDDKRVSSESEAEIMQAMDKLLNTAVRVDFKKQVSAFPKIKKQAGVDYQRAIIEGHAVNGIKIQTQGLYKGQYVETVIYEIYSMPPIAEYSYAVGQIGLFDKRFLTAPAVSSIPSKEAKTKNAATRNTRYSLMLRHTLAEHIKRMESEKKNGKPQNAHITYETLAAEAGIDITGAGNRKRRENMIRVIDDILTAYTKSKPPLLAGFEKYKKGRAYAGIVLKLR